MKTTLKYFFAALLFMVSGGLVNAASLALMTGPLDPSNTLGTWNGFINTLNANEVFTGVYTDTVIHDTYTSALVGAGTVRAITGSAVVGSGLAMTSGNLVGSRGDVTLPSGTSSTGGSSFLYGTQGKAILAGTLGAAAQTAGLVGQLDVSALTAGNASAVTSAAWFDMGATASAGFISTPGTSQILRLTNTTAAVIPQALYVEAYSTNLMEVHSTGEGEAWHSATCTPGSVTGGTGGLRITIDGVTKWIPLAATCS